MNIIDQFTNAWKVFCRPPRQNYSIYDLGTPIFQTKGIKCKRKDFKVKNQRGHTLECSYYEPLGNQNPDCIVYLHCFNGSRIESVKFAEPSISRGCAFCNFDFSGSGQSEGEFVSLGFYEQEDVSVIIAHLKQEMNVRSIALWGRSMGAVTALLYTQKFPSEVQALAIDSAFVSMWDAGLEIADKKGMLEYVRRQIKQNAGYDMDDVNTIKEISKCNMPVIFIVSKEDKLVSFENSTKLFEKYPAHAKKSILYVKGDHNECRSLEDIMTIADFLANTITKDNLNIFSNNKENSQIIQTDKSHYSTPNPRDEQKQQNIIKLIQSQQQQFQNKTTASPSHSVNINQLLQSKHTVIGSERPASHSISYQTTSQINQNQSMPNHQIQHHNKSVIMGNYQQTSNPLLKNLTTQNNNSFGVNDKKSHCHSTSNITQDHSKQLGNIGAFDKNHPIIDQKDIEDNPLIQSLLKDLIQKTYQQNSTEQSQKSLNSYELSQKNQSPQSIFLSAQQQTNIDYQKNMPFISSVNEFDSTGYNVLNKSVHLLQEQLQVQVNNQESNNQVIINQNQSQNLQENNNNMEIDNNKQGILNRKSSLVSPTTLDLKASNIPDEMHEIDFPKIKDFRTKAKINNYNFQVNPPGGTFQNQTIGIGEYKPSPSPLNDPSRKTSVSGTQMNNPLSSQNLYASIYKQEQVNLKPINPSTYSTINNSPQFFSEKSANSPKNIQSSCANKNLSQVLLEESINLPQTDNLTYNSAQQQQLQYQKLLSKNNLQNQQLQKSQQLEGYQQKQQQSFPINNHSRQSSILKVSNIMNSQEEEDIHHLPQSTLAINLKQRQRNQSEINASNPPPQTERQNINEAELRKQQLDIQQRKLTLDTLIQKPGNYITISQNNLNNIEQVSELEQSTTITNFSKAEGRSTVSNNIKQKCMNHSNHQSATIVRSSNSHHLEGSQNFQQQNKQNPNKEMNFLNSSANQPFLDHQLQQQVRQQKNLQESQTQQQKQQFSLNEEQQVNLQSQQQQLKQQLLPLIIQQQQEMQQSQQLKQQKQQSDNQLFDKQHKREISKEKQRMPTEQSSNQKGDYQNTQIQQNNYFVSIGKQNQKDDKIIESSQYEFEKNGNLNQNNHNNLSQSFQPNKDKQIQQQSSPQIYGPTSNFEQTSFYQNKKNHQPKHSHVFRYKIDIDNILTKNNGSNSSINKENENQKQSVSTSLIFHHQQYSHSRDRDSRINSTHINPSSATPSQQDFNEKQRTLQNLIMNDKSSLSQIDQKVEEIYPPNDIQYQQQYQQKSGNSSSNTNLNNNGNILTQGTNTQMVNEQLKSSQKVFKQQQFQFQSLHQQLQQNQGNYAQSPIESLNRNLGNKIPSNSQLHKANSPSQQNISQVQIVNKSLHKNSNDSMSISKGYDNSNIQKANESMNLSKLNISMNMYKGSDTNKSQNSKQMKDNQALLTEGSFSSKYSMYANLNINQQYGKTSTPSNSNQNFSSKQNLNEFKNQTLTNNSIVQEQKQNNNLNQQFPNNQNKIQNTTNTTKIYAPSPTQHAKHKILQKCTKDQKQIYSQPVARNLMQSEINNSSIGNYKDINSATPVLTQEDFNKKKQDMFNYLQKNRNNNINLLPDQGVNSVNQSIEEPAQNKLQSISNEQINVHKNRFNNNKEKSDNINFKLNSTMQSSHSPLSTQNQRYINNEDVNGSNTKKIQSPSQHQIPNFFQYKNSKNNYISSTLNSIDYQKNKNQRSNPQSQSPNQRLASTTTTSQKFAFKNKVNQATKVVQIQLGDKRQGEQNSFDGNGNSINNSNIQQYHQNSASQSPNPRLLQKY